MSIFLSKYHLSVSVPFGANKVYINQQQQADTSGFCRFDLFSPSFYVSVLVIFIVGGSSIFYTSPTIAQTPIPGLPTVSTSEPSQTQAQAPTATDFLNQGLQFIQAGRVQNAIASFRQAIQVDPSLAPAHYNLGLALRQIGQLQPAANAFFQATQTDPKFALAFANLGGTLLEGNNLQQANNYLQRSLEIDPKLGVAHYNLGLLRERQRDCKQAIVSFKKGDEI